MVYGDYAPKRDDEHWNCDMVNKSDAVLSDKAVKLIESAMSGNNKSERLLNAPINNTSGCPGVSLWKKKNIWCVNFSLNGSRLKIGYRDNRMDAIRLRLDVEEYVKGVIGDIANEDEICEIYEKTVEQITDSIRKRLDALM